MVQRLNLNQSDARRWIGVLRQLLGRWVLARDDYFVEIVFRQEEFGVGVVLEEFFDGPIGIDALHCVAGGFLGFDAVVSVT